MPVEAKVLRYAAAIDRAGRAAADEGPPADVPGDWTPEHLVLVGLVRCTLESLTFHARRIAAEAAGAGTANGLVTRRESDGRYAFVEVEVALDVEIVPAPDDVATLIERAERDCFVGSSLTASPTYRWTINGTAVGHPEAPAT